MSKLKLVIANKNYSSWSMRPWVLMRAADIPFEELLLPFGEDNRVAGIEGYSPTRKVPVLMVDNQPVWDSLAICETVAELFPGKQLWPVDPVARRMARSVAAEMHSGFGELRKAMPMNLRARHPDKGRTPGSSRDIARIVQIWEECRQRFGQDGPMLFGGFSCADAMFAPVATRFVTYAVDLPPVAAAYRDAILAVPAVREWCEAGRAETAFVAADEPYARTR
jgi:glutathione S-transferase